MAGNAGLSPNAISVLSLVFAAGAAACLLSLGHTGSSRAVEVALWLGTAVCIQLRLLCNLLDGLVAIEGGKKSPAGGLFNEVPDRIADVLILAAAGGCGAAALTFYHIPLGWAAAALAVMTAYVRVLGGTLGAAQSFTGPMAKQHRMAVLTAACLASIAEIRLASEAQPAREVLRIALTIIIAGCIITLWRRLRRISAELKSNA